MTEVNQNAFPPPILPIGDRIFKVIFSVWFSYQIKGEYRIEKDGKINEMGRIDLLVFHWEKSTP